MNTFTLLLGSIVYFGIAYVVYGGFLKRCFGIDNGLRCPSVSINDGVDYVATQSPVLFGHHFASIAGAGPIVGPVLAAKYGWVPAIIWILLGCVFIGAMHDFAAMFLSVRNQGRSIASVIEREVGYLARQVFLIFCLAVIVLVVAVFVIMVADSFVMKPEVATSSLIFIVMAPVFGICTREKWLSLTDATIVFVPLLFLAVFIGVKMPYNLPEYLGVSQMGARNIWICVLGYYVLVASIIPVWFLLQPRDYLNSYLLYAMMLLSICGIFMAHRAMAMPMVISNGNLVPGLVPMLFVTIACGACSGFHSMVASGTSSKQVAKENDILPISYGGMLVEGVLAIIAICSVGYLSQGEFLAIQSKGAQLMFAEGIGHFCEALGINFAFGSTFIALAISAFLLTSLDTGTRLGRFLLQELMLPSEEVQERAQSEGQSVAGAMNVFQRIVYNKYVSTIVVVALALLLALSNAGMELWPVFGASNQLMASLTLLVVTLYLLRKKKPYLFAMLPMFFMFIITFWALGLLAIQNFGKNRLLFVSSALVTVLAVVEIAVCVIVKLRKK